MSQQYQPSYTISSSIIHLIAQISEIVGRLTVLTDADRDLKLRRINRVQTIHGSLAIEGNTMSEEQITALMQGKKVLAPPREILEVRNAIAAYDQFSQWQPENEADLLQAHGVLMSGLIDEAGVYRQGGVGVMDGSLIMHMAPPANRVPALMRDLFRWLAASEEHPLLTSSVFHFEFEFIHPFADGNGRLGRLWQTFILSRWNPLFAHIPVESFIHEHQGGYYQALQESIDATDCAPFIEFMLRMIQEALASSHTTDQVTDQATDQVALLLQALGDQELGSQELMNVLNLSHRPTFRQNYLNPALEGGWIERTQPDSPRSPTQRYRLTLKGRKWLRAHSKK
ncbi:MAG: Fic family protein [Desulfovermiculus sp.]|nr:Fic family protein [Desulfovermiculus sp.]